MKAGQHSLCRRGLLQHLLHPLVQQLACLQGVEEMRLEWILHPDGLTVVHAAATQDCFVQQGALRVGNVLHALPAKPGIFQAFADQFHLPLAVTIQLHTVTHGGSLTQFHHRQKRVAQQRVDIDIRLFFHARSTANSSGFRSPMVPGA